jgi:SAM-dependent methyltransferase
MGYSDFVSLYSLDVKCSPEELLAERPLRFPIASNERGEALVNSLQQLSKMDLSGKRVLDVGCAYGGLSIALAKAGASVVGTESNPKLLAFAEANAYGTPDVSLSAADISSVSIRQKHAARSFDLIFLNDVLERSYEIDTIISNVDYLLAKDGLVYFKTVNNNSTRFILSDGYRKTFGLLLIDPDCWFYMEPKRASVYYRPLSTYFAMFQLYNMSKRVLIDEEQVLNRRTERRLSGQIKEIFAKARTIEPLDPVLKSILRKQTIKLRDRYVFDLQAHGEHFIKFKYGSAFFSGFFGRSDSVVELSTPTLELPEFGAIARPEQREEISQDIAPTQGAASETVSFRPRQNEEGVVETAANRGVRRRSAARK